MKLKENLSGHRGALYQELKRFKLRCLLDIQIQILVGSLIDESGVQGKNLEEI